MRTQGSPSVSKSLGIFLLLLPCAALFASNDWLLSAACAQEAKVDYKVLPFDETLKRDTNISKILRGDDGWSIEEHLEYFTKYFNTYVFAEMTLPENATRIPELRQAFYKKVWLAKNPAAYKALNELTLKTMQDFVNPKNNFHPAVQYNGILIVADLDAIPRGFGGRIPKPTPWPGAVKTLLACAELPVFPDHVRAGALIGLERQAEFGMSAQNRDEVTQVMLKVIQEKTPPATRDREVHDWMRRRACEILGYAGQTGGDNSVPRLLIDVMNDPQATLAFRCSAAQALGKLKYESGAIGIATDKLAGGMGDLTLAVCNDAKRRANTANEGLLARQATVRLNELKTGFAAPSIVGTDAEKSLAKDVSTQVELALTALQSGTGTAETLTKTARDLAVRLGKSAPAAAEKTSPDSPGTTPTTPGNAAPPTDDVFGGSADPF